MTASGLLPRKSDVMTIDQCVEAMLGIAGRLNDTASLRARDPGRWLEERDELARSLARLAGQLSKEHGRVVVHIDERKHAQRRSPAAPYAETIEVNGRRIQVQHRRAGYSV